MEPIVPIFPSVNSVQLCTWISGTHSSGSSPRMDTDLKEQKISSDSSNIYHGMSDSQWFQR